MVMRFHAGRLCLAAAIVALLSIRSYGQGVDVKAETPQLLKMKTFDSSLVLEAEQRNEKTRARDGSRSETEDSLRIWPLVNINMTGSIFHPNLLEYSFNGDLGMSWENGEIRTVEPPSSEIVNQRDGTSALRRYDAQLLFLKEKDYPFVLSAGRAVSRRDYDFFRRVTVDAEHYEANWSLKDKAWPMSIALSHRLEDIEDIERPETDENNRLLFTLRNQRSTQDMSDFRYSLDQYRYEKGIYPEQHGVNHSIQVLDVQTFDNPNYTPQDGSSLRSRLDFNSRNAMFDTATNLAPQLASTSDNSTRFAAMEDLKLQHSDDLASLYSYNFADNQTEGVNNTQHRASIGLRHQLYESLISTADVHTRLTSNSSSESDEKTRMVGTGFNEAYTKKLGDWGRLTLGAGGGLDSERRDSSGGSLSIVNENYYLSSGRLTLLRHPNVAPSSVVVTDSSGTTRYVESFDYVVVPHGQLVEIRRVVGGHIPEGDSVLVDYNAAGEPSDQFTTALNNLMFRLDFADNLVGVYGRHSGVNHSGGESLLLEEINNNAIGLDVKVERFRAGIEYQLMDSNLLPYNSMHSFQQYNFVPFQDCSLGIDFDQMAIVYKDTEEKQNMYSYIANCRTRLTARCSIDVQGGIRQEHGPMLNRDMLMTRTEFEFGMGQMSVRMGYELQDEQDIAEDRTRTLAYFRATRLF